jgi:hypothetical protein
MQQEGTYTALETCEAGIREAGQLLLDARPEAVDRCQAELQRVAETLERLVAEGTIAADSRIAPALMRIRQSTGVLKVQTEYAANLWSGWLQLRLGTGYTDQGLPVLITGEALGGNTRCSFEG